MRRDESPNLAQRPDGRKIKFNYSTTPAPGWYEDKPVPVARIFANAGTYTLYSEDHTVETYDSGGFPSNIRDQQSIGWTFTYDANHYLSRVTHTSGRYVSFTWSNGLLASVTDPAGNLYSYSFTLLPATAAASSASSMPASILHQAAVMQPNLQMDPGPDDPPPTPPSPPIQTMVALLTGVTQPGTAGYSASTNVSYQYENPTYKTALTGKTVNGSRFATYTYDSNGRVQQSGHANGAETYTFSYTLDANGAVTAATVTNPLGKQASYAFNALGDQVSITGVASTHCPASYKAISYDANGNPEASTDFNGNITSSTYSPNGLLQEQVVGYQTPVARRTTVTWDTTINRPLTIAVQGDHETDYTYTSDGRLATVSIKNLASAVAASAGQVHTTTYTYTKWPNGMLSSAVIDGPLSGSGDAITTTYSQSGDLLSTKDALGHATVYDNYNGLGKPGSVVGPNGDRHAFTFDARGRLIVDRTYRNQATQDKVYEYDGFGRLARVTNPDGQMHSYQYDVAGRLIEEYQPEAGGAYSATIYQYNAMSLPTSIVVERVYSEPKRGTVQ